MDREKVIKGLEEISDYFFGVYHHSKDREEINKAKDRCDAVEDALALLKEQEPIEPVDDGHGSLICGNQGYECGCVGRYDLTTKVVEKYCNFCPECGQAVKWNDR